MLSIKRKPVVIVIFLLICLFLILVFYARKNNDSGTACKPPKFDAKSATGSDLLCGLKVEEEYFGKPYVRNDFRYESDIDNDGQWTRSEILARDSTVEVTTEWRNGRLYVKTGDWLSPLDGRNYLDSFDVEVDHLVALKEAWESGAWKWKPERLKMFANDAQYPTLTVMSIETNRSKGEKDFAEWTPNNALCWYAQMWVLVKFRWNLSIDAAEKYSLSEAFAGDCGSISLKLKNRN